MSYTIIHGITIDCGDLFEENYDIGLSTISGKSYLQWSESPIIGYITSFFKSGIILTNGISGITERGSLEQGGNIVEYSGLNIKLADAEKLMITLKNTGINLTGLKCWITEFIGTFTDGAAISSNIIYTGSIEDQTWNDTTLTIGIKNTRYKRNVLLTSENDKGVVTPVTFGKLYPPDSSIINNLAKFVRTIDNKDDSFYNNSYFTGTNENITTYPVELFSSSSSLVQLSFKTYGNCINPRTLLTVNNTYIVLIGGTGEGQIRKINRMFIGVVADDWVTVNLDYALLTDPTISGDDRTWCQLIVIERNYNCDNFECKNFLKAEDGTATVKPEIYGYSDDEFKRIADFGLTITGTNNNALDIDGGQYSNDIDTIDSNLILPITSLALEDSPDLSKWSNAKFTYDYVPLSLQMDKVTDGIYSILNAVISVAATPISNAQSAYDRDSNTYAEHTFEITNTSINGITYARMLKFGLPKIDKTTNIDKIYLGVKLNINNPRASSFNNNYTTSSSDPAYSSLHFILRRFAYTKSSDVLLNNKNITVQLLTSSDVLCDCLPDYYYETNIPNTKSINYYKASESKTIGGYPGVFDQLSGYTLYEITDDVNIYNTFVEGGLFTYGTTNVTPDTHIDSLKIYEMAIIVKTSSSSIKKEIFSPLSGRVFADTWGARKTATNLIETAPDIIEHCRRLGNWTETGETGIEWGKEYATSALIKTSGEGSFDDSSITSLTDIYAGQLLDKDKCNSDSIIKLMCSMSGLCSYIDSNGYECITSLEPTSPSETITLADIIGDISDVIEPKVQNIFCEPLIRYQYNTGSGNYDKTMSVTNITAASWQSSYTPGFTDEDGVIVWNSCRLLYNKYRSIEPCPSSFSDLILVNNYTTAVNILKRKIAWMDKLRDGFSVNYSKGKEYHFGKHIMVQLPHHTNNIPVECVVESITKDKNKNRCDIDVVIIGTFLDYWQDTVDTGEEIQNTTDTGEEIIAI